MRSGTGSKAGAKRATVPVIRTKGRAGSNSGLKSRPVPMVRLWNGSAGSKKATGNARSRIVPQMRSPGSQRSRTFKNRKNTLNE